MKTSLPFQTLVPLALLLAALSPQPSTAFAQGTAFNYQGRLNDGTSPASGIYDLVFAIYDSASGGSQQGNTLTNTATATSNGLFTVTLDFGNQFPGADRWLEIWVRPSLVGSNFVALAPRQRLTSTPYAITAGNAITASNVTEPIAASQLPPGLVTNNGAGLSLSGSFTGNGAGLTNVSISTLAVTGPAGSSMVAWGENVFGQATIPTGLTNVAKVAAGRYHSLALTDDGTAVAWGDNSEGQTNVPPGLTNAIAVAAGGIHCLALKNDGSVVAWGYNASGQTNVPGGLNHVIAVAAGFHHNLALKNDGTVVAWGENGSGQTNVPPGLNSVAAVAAGSDHSLALKNDGTVVAWGDNSGGQTKVPASLTNAIAVAAGSFHSLALKNDGKVVAWGYNGFGQTSVPLGLNNVVAVAAGYYHSLALKNDGTVVAWGDNQSGQTTLPSGLNNVVALAGGCGAYHALVIQQQVRSPLAQLVGPNTFTGLNTFNGKVGINTTPTETLQIKVPSDGSGGVGMRLDSDQAGHSPAVYLNHTGPGGHNFRLASFGDNANPGSFVVRDDTAGADRLTINANGVISGNGSGLTLSTNVAVRAGGNSFSGNQTFNGNLSLSSSATVSGSLNFGSQTRQMVNLWGSSYGIGVQASSLYFRSDSASANDGFIWYKGGVHNDGYADAGGGVELMHLVQGALYVNGTLASTSDRNAKENFQPVDAQDVLNKVVALPITRWHYTNDSATPHLGPVAQDFHAAFGVGPDDKHIATVDADGVALAAIQGLNEKLEVRSEKLEGRTQKSEDRILKLEAENADLKQELANLKRVVEALGQTRKAN